MVYGLGSKTIVKIANKLWLKYVRLLRHFLTQRLGKDRNVDNEHTTSSMDVIRRDTGQLSLSGGRSSHAHLSPSQYTHSLVHSVFPDHLKIGSIQTRH